MLISYPSASKTSMLLAGMLTVFLVTVSAKIALSQNQEPITSIEQPKSAAVSSHIPQSTTGLDKKLTIPAKRQPLSKMMFDVESAATGIQLSQAGSVQDVSVYYVLNAQAARSLLTHIQQLFTDSEWQYQWQERTADTDHPAYRLWRQPVDLKAQQVFARQQAQDRLSQLLEALNDGSQAGNGKGQEDSAAAYILAQPVCKSRLAMLGTLSQDQIDGILDGQPLTIPYSSLSPDQQTLINQSVGGYQFATSTGPDGATTTDFNMQDLDKSGYVVVRATPAGPDPGALSISLNIYSQPNSSLSMGGDVFHPDPDAEVAGAAPKPNDPVSDPDQPVKATVPQTADTPVPLVKAVTIKAALNTQPNQSPLEAYLSTFAAQTHFSVLGLWPDSAKEPQQRLSQSITQRPVVEALDTLARTYHARYIVKDQTVLFRIGFPKTPPAKSTSTTPTAALSPTRPK